MSDPIRRFFDRLRPKPGTGLVPYSPPKEEKPAPAPAPVVPCDITKATDPPRETRSWICRSTVYVLIAIAAVAMAIRDQAPSSVWTPSMFFEKPHDPWYWRLALPVLNGIITVTLALKRFINHE